MSNNKKHESAAKLWTRILCIILAVLMVGSVAYLAIQLISESISEARAEKEKAESTTTKAQTTTKAPASTTTKAPDTSASPSN